MHLAALAYIPSHAKQPQVGLFEVLLTSRKIQTKQNASYRPPSECRAHMGGRRVVTEEKMRNLEPSEPDANLATGALHRASWTDSFFSPGPDQPQGSHPGDPVRLSANEA